MKENLGVRMRKRSISLLLLIAALGITQVGNAKVAIGTMAGTVVDSHGKPVAGATVTMQTSDGSRPYARHSDANGRFEFTRFEPGQYDLRAYCKGVFSDWTKRVSIHTGKTTEVTLRMPPPADESVTVTQ
jgi:Carboxypeptidase regulatory-like domain